MSLFSKRKKVMPALISDEELDATCLNYNTVLEYLVGLSGDDYTKICQVAAVYRQADFEACKVLGVENEPTTFITPPEQETEPSSVGDDFIDMLEETPKAKSKSKKIKVNE